MSDRMLCRGARCGVLRVQLVVRRVRSRLQKAVKREHGLILGSGN